MMHEKCCNPKIPKPGDWVVGDRVSVFFTKDKIALACLSIGLPREQIKRILELLPDGETPSLPGQPDRLFYSVPEEKILGLTEAALEKAGRQITGVEPDGC